MAKTTTPRLSGLAKKRQIENFKRRLQGQPMLPSLREEALGDREWIKLLLRVCERLQNVRLDRPRDLPNDGTLLRLAMLADCARLLSSAQLSRDLGDQREMPALSKALRRMVLRIARISPRRVRTRPHALDHDLLDRDVVE